MHVSVEEAIGELVLFLTGGAALLLGPWFLVQRVVRKRRGKRYKAVEVLI
jgi:hypothetical protein